MRFFKLLSLAAGFVACQETTVEPPLIEVLEPAQGQEIFRQSQLQLSGSVTDENGLSNVWLNLKGGEGEKAYFVTGHSSEELLNFPPVYILDLQLEIPDTCSLGAYTLEVFARDKEGNELRKDISLQLIR